MALCQPFKTRGYRRSGHMSIEAGAVPVGLRMTLRILLAFLLALSVAAIFIAFRFMTGLRIRSQKRSPQPKLRDDRRDSFIPKGVAPTERGGRRRRFAPAHEGGANLSGVAQIGVDGFYNQIECKLDEVFSLLERGRISIKTYISDVHVQRRIAFGRLESLNQAQHAGTIAPDAYEFESAETRSAIEAIDWCLAWASELEDNQVAKGSDVDEVEGSNKGGVP